MKGLETKGDEYFQKLGIHKQLGGSIFRIWQDYAFQGNGPDARKWGKQFVRLENCQKEWVGFRADCCKEATRPVGVPIGCGHRLCPLCCAHRSKKARARVEKLFDRFTHPVLLTLTIPNLAKIRKRDFDQFRRRVRQFIAQHKDSINGGIYSLETTYNRTAQTWHIHTHVLIDWATALPEKGAKTDFLGRRGVFEFSILKLRLEFDWLRLWSTSWGRVPRKNASLSASNGDAYRFEEWVLAGWANTLREKRGGNWRPIQGLAPEEIARRTAWNKANRRLVDIRPVRDRAGAAREVLKYITKSAAFSDLPEAVEPFYNATRGARLVQTFGSCYGLKIDNPDEPVTLDDWGGKLKCACGQNHWLRMGIFSRKDMEMDAAGRWWLKLPLDHNSRGTVLRPTIRALADRLEQMAGEDDNSNNQPGGRLVERLG